MTTYEVGSIASLIAPQEGSKNKRKSDALAKLFSGGEKHAVVTHVPVVSPETVPEKVEEKKTKKKKKSLKQPEKFAISVLPTVKKNKNIEELDQDEIETALKKTEAVPEDENDDMQKIGQTESEGRRLKKIEVKNLKKKRLQKGKPSEEADAVIMVKNLPTITKKKELMKHFSKFGKIDAVWFRCAPIADPSIPKKVAFITKEFHPARQTISAFIRFENSESAKEALSLTGTEFKERHISVSLSDDTKKDLDKGVFVGNLPFDIEDEDLWQHFSDCGVIHDVRIIRDSNSGLGKGFGYVNFSNPDSVELALRLNESTLRERQLRVTRCKRNPKPKVTPVQGKKAKSFAKKKSTAAKPEPSKGSSEPHSFAGETSTQENKNSGAFRRIKQKREFLERKNATKDGAEKVKPNANKGSNKLSSFSGDVATTKQRAAKKGKIIKRSKEEQRKAIIAAKLGFSKPKTT